MSDGFFGHSHHWRPPVFCSSLIGNALFSSSSLFTPLLAGISLYFWLIYDAVYSSLQAATLGKTIPAPHLAHGKQAHIFCTEQLWKQTTQFSLLSLASGSASGHPNACSWNILGGNQTQSDLSHNCRGHRSFSQHVPMGGSLLIWTLGAGIPILPLRKGLES